MGRLEMVRRKVWPRPGGGELNPQPAMMLDKVILFLIRFRFQTKFYRHSFVPPLLYSPMNLSAPKAVEEAFILEEIPHPLQ